MILGARDRIPLKYRLAYLVLYTLLIVYPLYRIATGIMYLPLIYSIIVIFASLLIILGMVYSSSELIILYYVLTAIVFKVCMVKEPSVEEFIIYSLVILHGDIISKMLVYGVGYRRIRSSLKGALMTVSVIFTILLLYLAVAYVTTGLFIDLSDRVVKGNILSEITFGKILTTRFGNLVLLIMIILSVLHVLSRYVSGVISDILSLNPVYAIYYIRSSIKSSWDLLNKGDTWHQKLLSRTMTTFILFFTWVLVLPVYFIIADIVPALLGVQLYILSFATSIVISAILYTSIRRGILRLLRQKASLELPRLSLEKPSSIPLLAAIALLVAYVVSLLIYYKHDAGLLCDVFIRSLGLGKPHYDQYLNGVVEIFERTYINILDSIMKYINKYVSCLVEEFDWMTGLIKSLIELLWGR